MDAPCRFAWFPCFRFGLLPFVSLHFVVKCLVGDEQSYCNEVAAHVSHGPFLDSCFSSITASLLSPATEMEALRGNSVSPLCAEGMRL